MQEFVIFQGLPRSGKSTHSKEYMDKGYQVFELDHERELITGSRYLEDDEPYVWLCVRNLVIFHLKLHHNVVIDECNPTWSCLLYWINAARNNLDIYGDYKDLKIKIVRFTEDKDTCISRCDPNDKDLINAIIRKDKNMMSLNELRRIRGKIYDELIIK